MVCSQYRYCEGIVKIFSRFIHFQPGGRATFRLHSVCIFLCLFSCGSGHLHRSLKNIKCMNLMCLCYIQPRGRRFLVASRSCFVELINYKYISVCVEASLEEEDFLSPAASCFVEFTVCLDPANPEEDLSWGTL